jgi:hypothetical protein
MLEQGGWVSESRPIPKEEVSDRRRRKRFPLSAQVQYKMVGRGKRAETGTGQAKEISSQAIAFASDKPLPVGARLELSVSWPVRLDDRCLLKLVAQSRVIRYQDGVVVAEIERWEFRTQRSKDLNSPLVCTAPPASAY